jgi:hypothetical protein
VPTISRDLKVRLPILKLDDFITGSLRENSEYLNSFYYLESTPHSVDDFYLIPITDSGLFQFGAGHNLLIECYRTMWRADF